MTEPGLFPEPAGLVPLAIPGADVRLLRRLALAAAPEEVLARLVEETPWRSETIEMWGRTVPQPRLLAWYGDAGASYTYSGRRFDPLPWTDLLADLRRRVEAATSTTFNSVLVNYYRDHRDSVAMHSDDERELGPRPVIASLSLGETRTLVFRSRFDRSLKNRRLPLESGSLLLMQGDTQRLWQHAVPKQTRPCGPRLNLTFRRVLGDDGLRVSRRTRGSA